MSFVASVFEAVVDVVVSIVEAVVSIVEIVVEAVMVLLGFDGGSTQVIEYYEVHNIPLFDDPDRKDPLLNSILQSILANQDIVGNLIYHTAFRSLKGNVKEFMDFIDNGNYFESFPTVESYILTIDYTELTAALNTLNGVPCTPEGSYLRALSKADWVKYWLQENKEYDVGTNGIGSDYSTTSTTPITPAATGHTHSTHYNITITDEIGTSDSVTVNALSPVVTSPSTTSSSYTLINEFTLAVTDELATSDSVIADERWQVNLNTIVYNSGTDTYSVDVYNAAGFTITLPYTVPSKPTQLHYVSTYYRDSAPSRYYLFIYQAGSGTYTDLDTIEEPIDIDGTTIEALPAVPLRLSNANYTTFGATKRDQIEDLLSIIHLDAETVLDTILDESAIAPGDLDHIYINFGVRMWDTSQAGMSYLFTMFENLYPAQGVTQGTYNDSPAGDDKPQNNIIVTTDDNKLAYQWSYITFEHTSLVDIDGDSGSVENGIYYSDMSKFDADDTLIYNYYVSSGKGTYNVGYKADNLSEVQDFLDGNGVPNPGTTSGEATNWLQVTERLSYNNPTPNLLEADNSASDLKYLTPDLVYENNGSGTLRLVEAASDATTVGQSITYYCCKPSGLDAYTVVAPIASCRVVDGSSGHFRVVKFNLGNKGDLMVPLIHTFIKDLSNAQVSKLFLTGAHASIYVAHYEKIVHEGMSFLQALVIIVIIVVIIVVAWKMAPELGELLKDTLLGELIAAGAAGGLSAVVTTFFAALPGLFIDVVVHYFIQLIISEIAGDNEMLALLLNIVSMAALSGWEGGELGFELNPDYSINWEAGLNTESLTTFNYKSLSDFTALDYAKVALKALNVGNTILVHKTRDMRVDLEREMQERKQLSINKWDALEKIRDDLNPANPELLASVVYAFRNTSAVIGAERYNYAMDRFYDIQYMQTNNSLIIQQQVSPSSQIAFA